MAGRTTNRWTRAYLDGYDMSGYMRTVGPLLWSFEEADVTATLADAAMGYLPNHPTMSPGTLKGVFDNTASTGLHVVASGAGVTRVCSFPIGMRAAPAAGDPVYCGQFLQTAYSADEEGGAVMATIPFTMWDAVNPINYTKPWGSLLHPLGSETGANAAAGIDDRGAATALGGFFVYHIISITGAGTVTLTVEEASTNTDVNFAALTDATSGAIATASAPTAAIVPVGVSAAVKRYLRWQIEFGASASACSFLATFVRI